MILALFMIVLAAGAALTLSDWRKGMLFLIVVGFLQDPMRKVFPGHPVHLQVLVVAFLLLTFWSAFLRGRRFRLSLLCGGDRRLKQAWRWFILLIVFQLLHTLIRYGNPVLAGLGLMTYLAPLAAIWFGVSYAHNEQQVRKIIHLYLALAIPAGLTIYLSYWFGDRSVLLQSIGELTDRRLLISDVGRVLYSYSGILRVGEIAAWHAATAIMLLAILVSLDKRRTVRMLAAIVAALLIGAIILTGRRKMLMTLAVFFATYSFLLVAYWNNAKKVGALLLLLGIGAAGYLQLQGDDQDRAHYVARGTTVFADSGGRLALAFDLLRSAVTRGGVIGKGAGVSAQGSQYFGGGVKIVGGAAEAGMGKVVVELGLIGALVVVYLIWCVLEHFRALFRSVPVRYGSAVIFLSGLTAVLVANIATFLVASQLYGDMFIVLMVGFMISFLFAFERMTRQQQAFETYQRQRMIQRHDREAYASSGH